MNDHYASILVLRRPMMKSENEYLHHTSSPVEILFFFVLKPEHHRRAQPLLKIFNLYLWMCIESCSMINKNPETDVGAETEDQKSKTTRELLYL